MSFEQPALPVVEGSTVQLCGVLSLPAETIVSVDVVISGGSAQVNADFSLSPSSQILMFSPGDLRRCLEVQVVDDQILEQDEDVNFSLESGQGFVLISPVLGSAAITIPNQNSKR